MIVTFGVPAQAQTPPRPLRLGEAIEYARAHYPSVRAALEEKAAADHEVNAARAAYLPQVNLLWQINRSTVNNVTGLLLPQGVIPSVSGPVLPENDQAAWNSGAGLVATWRPFDFGYRAARVDAARQAEVTASQTANLTELEVVVATSNAYMNLAAAQSLASVAQANVDRLHSFSTVIGVLVQNKLRAGVEADQAAAAEGMAQSVLINAKSNVEAQRATLAKLVGRPAAEVVIDSAALAAPPPPGLTTGASIEAHPSALREAARVKQQSAQLRAIERSYAPQIDLIGSASARGEGKTPAGAYLSGNAGLRPDVNNWAVGVQVSMPLGAIPSLRAQQQAQGARLRAEQARYEQVVGDLNEGLVQARAALRGAEDIANITPAALAAARRGEEQQRIRYQSGLATVVDVTVAQAALAQAESQDAIARLNVWRAMAALSAAQGDPAALQNLATAR